jgi:hypothetical protein
MPNFEKCIKQLLFVAKDFRCKPYADLALFCEIITSPKDVHFETNQS